MMWEQKKILTYFFNKMYDCNEKKYNIVVVFEWY